MSLFRSDDTIANAESVRILRTEAFFHKIYQQVATGIAVSNLQGVFLQCNPAYCALVGYTEKELRTMPFASLIHPEDREANLTLVHRLRVGEIPSFEIDNRYIHKNGESVWVHKLVFPLHDKEGEPTDLIALVTNITARKLTEKVLLRQSAIVESSDDAIIGTDATGTVTDWNNGAERLFGYLASEAIGKNISFLTPVDHLDEMQHILKKVINGGVVKHRETVRQRKDGTRVEISLTVSSIVDGEGQIVGVSKIARDITERKRAETAIRESEGQYRRIVETASEGVWLLDSKLHTSYVNRQMSNMLGYEPEEMVGRSVFDFYFPEDVEYKKQVLLRRQRGVREQLEERLRRKDGSILWARMAGSPIFKDNGEFDGALAMVCDITERKLAEEALRISEERLRLAQWAARVGTFDFDIRTGVDTWTPETEALYGLPPGGFDGTLTAFENLIHPDDRQKVMELTHKTITTGEATEGEWRTVWPDGSVHWIAGRGQLIKDESGEPWRLIGVNIDITESKRAEEALLGMTRKLVEAQEQERARIARELHDDIAQRLALLAIEIGQVQVCAEKASEVRKLTHELVERTKEISSDVQDLSHELHSTKVDYLGIVRGMKSWCGEFGERQKLQITFESHNVPQLPREISLCLFRVLQEALQNAAKHSGAKQIEVKLMENSGEIHLTVSDSGKGFEVKAPGQSRGLGLTSMQERVRLVNGTIEIQSKPMSGTTILVRVPFKSEDTRKRQKAATTSEC